MIHIALRTEFSFKQCFGHLKQIVKDASKRGDWALGIADKNNTFGHIKFEKYCKEFNIKPIFGVRLSVTDKIIKARGARNSYNYISEFIFIARNNKGLVELNKLVATASDAFYYFPRLSFANILNLSDNVIILADYVPNNDYEISLEIDYKYVSQSSVNNPNECTRLKNIPICYIDNNRYSMIEDRPVYEMLSSPKTELQTYPQHILSEIEVNELGIQESAINNTELLASEIDDVSIPHSKMLKYNGEKTLYNECIKGAIKRNVDLDDPVYSKRFQREFKLINDRDFGDYFLIVSSLIREAKEYCLIGPGRGSSGGSLICYLISITEIDPIKHGLLFDRFIDINRMDLPDIDTDVPDIHRQKIVKSLYKKYNFDNVKSIGTISKYKAKSAIVDFSKALDIPAFDSKELKDSIIERTPGDARAEFCIKDSINETTSGKIFIKKYPEMQILEKIEGHSRHSGKHAAGIIIANKPLYNYSGINNKESIIMMDGIEAESINLLKIDILGLRTLSVLEDTAKLANFNYSDFYNLSLNDTNVFDIFNSGRLYGIFQFEGHILRTITSQINVDKFSDICAITSLGRPGALNSGGTNRYIKRKKNSSDIKSHGEIYDNVTKDTFGITIFQEQTMKILRDFGNLSWGDVNILRRAMSKTYGDEFFAKYKNKFIEGGLKNNYTKKESEEVWKTVANMGSYGFNLSHAVGYSIISYWTAWCKTYHPLEFAAANLNNAKDDESSIKILRDFVINDRIEYIPIDPDTSDVNWSIVDGKLIGGLTNLDGVGLKKAQGIVKTRKKGGRFTPAIMKKLINPVTPFDILFPTKHYFGRLYSEPHKFGLDKPPSKISEVYEPGNYTIIGMTTAWDLRDRNDVQSVMKRGHKVDENQFYLNLYIEDDTDSIKCMIPPFHFNDMDGNKLAEKSIPGETWYLIKGVVRDQWRSISIEAITEIKKTGGYGKC